MGVHDVASKWWSDETIPKGSATTHETPSSRALKGRRFVATFSNNWASDTEFGSLGPELRPNQHSNIRSAVREVEGRARETAIVRGIRSARKMLPMGRFSARGAARV